MDDSCVTPTAVTSPSFRGSQPAQPTRPPENAFVSGHETVALQRSRDDQTISRVGMEIGKAGRADSDRSIDGDFEHALFQLLPTPQTDVFREPDPSPVLVGLRRYNTIVMTMVIITNLLTCLIPGKFAMAQAARQSGSDGTLYQPTSCWLIHR